MRYWRISADFSPRSMVALPPSDERVSSPNHPPGRPAVRCSTVSAPRRFSASRTRISQAACTSHENAAAPGADQQLVGVTHPFHPLFAQHLPCIGRRYNRYGERLLLQARDGIIWSVPPRWTDVVSPDPEVVMGHGRSLLRVSDLMELAHLVDSLKGKPVGRLRSGL